MDFQMGSKKHLNWYDWDLCCSWHIYTKIRQKYQKSTSNGSYRIYRGKPTVLTGRFNVSPRYKEVEYSSSTPLNKKLQKSRRNDKKSTSIDHENDHCMSLIIKDWLLSSKQHMNSCHAHKIQFDGELKKLSSLSPKQ